MFKQVFLLKEIQKNWIPMGYDLEVMDSGKSRKSRDESETKKSSRLAFYLEGRESAVD
jgi:hypothetical protein